MKNIRNLIIAIVLLLSFACNNKQSKKAEGDVPEVKDLNVDKSLIKKPDNTDKIEFKPCKSIVTEILTSSPRYKQFTKGLNEAVVKNGGLSFGINLEGSPNPKLDTVCCYSSNYDFSVYESYTDRQLSTARFSFNPNNKQLYEYDAIHDQLKPIEFDRSLLVEYKAFCK